MSALQRSRALLHKRKEEAKRRRGESKRGPSKRDERADTLKIADLERHMNRQEQLAEGEQRRRKRIREQTDEERLSMISARQQKAIKTANHVLASRATKGSYVRDEAPLDPQDGRFNTLTDEESVDSVVAMEVSIPSNIAHTTYHPLILIL